MSIRVYIDGQIQDSATAKISVFDRGFLFGDSVYETIARIDGRLIFLGEHLDRLERSARRIFLEPPARAAAESAIAQCVAATGEEDARVRIIVTRGAGSVDIDPATAGPPQIIVITQPLCAPTLAMLASGVSAEIVRVSRNAQGSVDPAVKSGNYLQSVLAITEARRRRPGANEAILCSGNGGIAEGASSNVFMVEAGCLETPAIEVGILDGVTRGKVLALARSAGIETRELAFLPPDKLRVADEVFLTSAVRGILPVTTLDGAQVGDGLPGTVTRQLLSLYQRLVAQTP